MKIHSKAAIALLALIISAPFALAQDPGQQGPPPDGPGGGRNFMWRQGPVGDGDDDHDGGWRHDGEEGMEGHGHPGRMLDRLVNNPDIRERLGITDEQAAKIRHQFTAFRIAEIRNRADAEVKRVELHELLTADNPDKAAIDAKIDEIGAARLAEAKARVDFGLSMKDALTPDQRAKLKELMRKRFSEHDRDDFGPHGQHGMGPGQQGAPPTAPDGQAPANPPNGPGAE